MSLKIYRFDKAIHWSWYTSRIPTVWADNMGGIVVIDTDTGTPQAAALYEDWTKASCVMSVIIDNPMVLRHGFLETAFHFVFNTADRIKVFARIASKNKKSLNFVEKLGFTRVAVLEDGCEVGNHWIIFELKKEDCKYIKYLREVA